MAPTILPENDNRSDLGNFPKDVEYYSSEEFDQSHRNQDFFEDIDGIEVSKIRIKKKL